MNENVKTYIIEQCKDWMTRPECNAIEIVKNDYLSKYLKASSLEKWKLERTYGLNDVETLRLVGLGKDKLEKIIIERLLNENDDILNYCPKCGELARTPYAKQCRYCKYDWHNVVAKIKLHNSFQVTSRYCYLVIDIVEGKINKGNRIDFNQIIKGFSPTIKSIEFIAKKKETKIGIGIDELDDMKKEIINNSNGMYDVIN